MFNNNILWIKQNIFPITLALINTLIAILFISLFDQADIVNRITVEISGFLVGLLTGIFAKKIYSSHSTLFRYCVSSLALLITLVTTTYFIYPLLIVFLLPFKETNLHSICCETPLDYGASSYESLQLKMDDDAIISGWYIPPNKSVNAVIILVHGHNNDRRGEYLIKSGYGIFMYDQRGNGESTGEMDFFQAYLSTDLLKVSTLISQKVGTKKMGAVGLSMGAHSVINAVDLNQQAFSAVWLDGLYPQSEKDLFGDLSAKATLIMFLDNRIINIMRLLASENIARPISDILPELTHPQVMLTAGALEDIEHSANQKYATFANNNIHSWIIPNGHHLTGPYDIPDEYSQRLIAFFDGALKEKPITNP